MDPATICCPHLACPARGQVGQGHLGIHSHQEPRCVCRPCRKTFTATTGTAFDRLRTPADRVTLVLTRLAHGCPLQAIVVACACDERTVAAWMARAGEQSRAVHASLVEQPRDLGQVQAEESRVKQQGGVVWMALAMMVRTRWWLAGAVSAPRDLPRIRRLIEPVRKCALCQALVFCTDGWCSYVRASRETFRDAVYTGACGRPSLRPWPQLLIAQVVKRYPQRRVVGVERRIIQGTATKVEQVRAASQGDGVINTADIERRNATFRERLAALTRRGRALARQLGTLEPGMYLIGTVYHFCTMHASLRVARTTAVAGTRTPAMAAAITDHCWTVRELLACHVPPPRWTPPKRRGRPARALQRLRERWCRDHD